MFLYRDTNTPQCKTALETGLKGPRRAEQERDDYSSFSEGGREMRSHGNSSSPSFPLAGKQVSCPSLVLLVSALRARSRALLAKRISDRGRRRSFISKFPEWSSIFLSLLAWEPRSWHNNPCRDNGDNFSEQIPSPRLKRTSSGRKRVSVRGARWRRRREVPALEAGSSEVQRGK